MRDETTAPVLAPGRGKTKTGYLWALARDDRSWGGEDPPGVVYFYAPLMVCKQTTAGQWTGVAENMLKAF